MVVGIVPVRVGRCQANGGLAQLGEHLPYKQGSAVRSVILHHLADLAQLVEQLTCNQ